MVDWLYIDTAVLRGARDSKGLSYEAMGRQLNVAAKTWERWEKAGRIPRHEVTRVATVLGLEISEPALQAITLAAATAVDDDALGSMLRHALADLQALQVGQAEISQRLARLEDQQSGGKDSRAKNAP